MASGMQVSKLEIKSHDQPDELRTPNKTRVEVVRLKDYTMGRFIFQPGWRWSDCVKPVVKTESCQAAHVGYAVSGSIKVRMKTGRRPPSNPACHTPSRPDMTHGWREMNRSSV
jgi:hypothetical protein